MRPVPGETEEEQPSLENIADRVYDDHQTMNEAGYEWIKGALRGPDYESREAVERALRSFAGDDRHQFEEVYRDEETGAQATFEYLVSHIDMEDTLEDSS